jgi:outer membrane protein assembly factor BamB
MKIVLFGVSLIALGLQAADWPMFGGDPQRTGWAKNEKTISPDTAGKLRLEWSLKVDNAAKELNSLSTPIVVENVITPRGFKDIVITAGSSDKVVAIDADTGKILWQKSFQIEGSPKNPQGGWLCPNALNATPIIDRRSSSLHVLTSDGKLHTLNYVNGEDRKPPLQFVPPFAKAWSLNLQRGVLYTTTSQGCNGVRSAIYAMDLNDPNRAVSSFVASPTGGAGIWGRAGAAVSNTTGLIYAETGDGSFDPETGKYSDTFLGVSSEMKLVDYYTPANRAWISKKDLDMGNISPVVFPFENWELVAGGGKEGVLFLLDAKSLGGADHRTPLFRSPLYTNEDVDFAGRGFWGALSTWQDPKGTRWLYAPAWGPPASSAPQFPITHGETKGGSIMAFKVVSKDKKLSLDPAWISKDMSVPEPVVIANGVVLALSNGENVRQVDSGGRLYTSLERANTPSGNAILYALDAVTGKELFSSAKTITSFSHFSGLAVASGRVYVITWDSTIYAFGVPQ